MIRVSNTGAATGPLVVIVGASARAAAWSALRAGLQPLCIDQFADADLQAVAPVNRVGQDPEELIAAAAQYPAAPWMYTGGLENHPEIVERVSEHRPLWGMGPNVLRQVRDPLAVATALAGARLPALQVRGSDSPPDADGHWMLKPLRSGGGRGIAVWTPEAKNSPTLDKPHYFQQRIVGPAYSGLFIARPGVGDVRFVGLTEQLIGQEWLHARPFAWCGNIGPAFLDVQWEHSVRRIANFLKWKFSLCGMFGVDFIVSAEGRIGVTEVNPRYPASMEILEFATGAALLRDHAACFLDDEPDWPAAAWQPAPDCTLGKAVVYAAHPCTRETALPFTTDLSHGWPVWGDVPKPGTSIGRGEPIATVYAQAATTTACAAQLRLRAEHLLNSL